MLVISAERVSPVPYLRMSTFKSHIHNSISCITDSQAFLHNWFRAKKMTYWILAQLPKKTDVDVVIYIHAICASVKFLTTKPVWIVYVNIVVASQHRTFACRSWNQKSDNWVTFTCAREPGITDSPCFWTDLLRGVWFCWFGFYFGRSHGKWEQSLDSDGNKNTELLCTQYLGA